MDFLALLVKNLPSFVGLLFTILILSYVVGDNPAFRLAVYAFIGISAGYVTAIVLIQVIVNQMILPVFSGGPTEWLLEGIPLVLGLVLFEIGRAHV